MGIAFSTPYYLSGKQARAWHTNKGEKAAMAATGLGAIGYGLTKPKFQGLASTAIQYKGLGVPKPEDYGAASQLFLAGAGVTAGYGAYHYGRAAIKNKHIRDQKKRNGYSKTSKAFHSSRQAHGNVD